MRDRKINKNNNHDQAALIGKEFEKMIETFGVESLTGLMPKVIKALENLETLCVCFYSRYTMIYLCPIICEGCQLYVKVEFHRYTLSIVKKFDYTK
jgi:hypothetical protein